MRCGATGLLALASPQNSMPRHEEACPQRAANEGTRGEGCALLTSTAKINSERKLLCPAGNFSSAMLTPQELTSYSPQAPQTSGQQKKTPKLQVAPSPLPEPKRLKKDSWVL